MAESKAKLSEETTDPKPLFTFEPEDQLKGVEKHGRLPSIALAALLTLFLSSGAGIAFSVVSLLYSLRVAGDLPSRLLVFSASVVGIIYVVIHIWASRTHYTVTQHGPPWLYGNNLHTCAILLSRLGLAGWIAAIVLTSLLTAEIGISLAASLADQTIYLNIVICAVAL